MKVKFLVCLLLLNFTIGSPLRGQTDRPPAAVRLIDSEGHFIVKGMKLTASIGSIISIFPSVTCSATNERFNDLKVQLCSGFPITSFAGFSVGDMWAEIVNSKLEMLVINLKDIPQVTDLNATLLRNYDPTNKTDPKIIETCLLQGCLSIENGISSLVRGQEGQTTHLIFSDIALSLALGSQRRIAKDRDL